MKDKSVLILGATSDIAVAIAKYYKQKGASVMLAARNTATLSSDVKSLGSTHSFDATDFGSHKNFFTSLPSVPDVTVCVFGYLGDQSKAETNWDEAKRIIDTNYTGCVSILNIVADAYAKKRTGTIVGISSVAGDRGRQSNYIYGSAKAGFTAYLSGLRNKLFKQGVNVITVKPGFVNTKMTAGLKLPPALTAQPDQVARRVGGAVSSAKSVVYVLPIWALIMLVIRCLPEFIFKRMKL
jgi:decaprenylphospho-beta-D-erythro-pentofuranosid-2-ulose 2-reductase